MTKHGASLAERFWAKVEKGPGCWKWKGATIKTGGSKGYGMIGSANTYKLMRAHRAAYELVKGMIPEGLEVMHDCDNPNCVNPSHLKLGTHRENMLDAARKGRLNRKAKS